MTRKLLVGSALLMPLLAYAAQMPGKAPAAKPPAPPPPLVNELSANFVEHTGTFDYTRREMMIPMRDGIHLHTVIFIPRDAHRAPILLSRTPYGADLRFGETSSARISAVMANRDVADDLVEHDNYIRVIQDVRGKHGSEATTS